MASRVGGTERREDFCASTCRLDRLMQRTSCLRLQPTGRSRWARGRRAADTHALPPGTDEQQLFDPRAATARRIRAAQGHFVSDSRMTDTSTASSATRRCQASSVRVLAQGIETRWTFYRARDRSMLFITVFTGGDTRDRSHASAHALRSKCVVSRALAERWRCRWASRAVSPADPLTANDAYRRMFGVARASALGLAQCSGARRRAQARREWVEAMRRGKPFRKRAGSIAATATRAAGRACVFRSRLKAAGRAGRQRRRRHDHAEQEGRIAS